MKRKRETKKAISLIVLVITIIIMIILASAIIITLSQNGIIGKANEAVEETNLKQVQQAATLAWSDAYIGGARDVDDLKAAVDQALLDAKIDISKYEITVTTNGVTVELKETTAEPDEGGEGSGDTIPTQLSAPTISLSGDVLTITDNATNGSYTANFEVYVGSDKKATITASSTTTFDLTTLELEAGTYNITVKAVAAEGTTIAASEASISVEYVVEEASNIPEEWKASVTAIVDEVPIPKGFVASPYGEDKENNLAAENKKASGLVIYELTEDERIKGATELPSNETRQTSWIKRNQYVWVPVDKAKFETEFVRKDYINSTSTLADTLGTSAKYWEVIPTTELSTDNLKYMTEDTLTEAQAMYESVRKYGGFYIARYEAGIDKQRSANGTSGAELPGIKEGTSVYSVMGKIPYTYIPWTWDNVMNKDTKGAVEVARRVYPKNNTNYGVVSTLTYGVQWDRTVQWFIDTAAMTLNQVKLTEGSTAFGNYSDHVIAKSDLNDGALVWDYSTSKYGSYVSKDSNTLTYPKESGKKWGLSTGALKVANINNIYDMAGNMFEWTMEGLSADYRVYHGGGFGLTGTSYPVASRSFNSPHRTCRF